MKLEAKIEADFVKFAEGKGCLALKLRVDGVDGFPDRTVITPKGIFFVEFKRTSKDRLRPQQRRIRNTLAKLGYEVWTVHDVEAAKDILSRWLRR